MAKHRVHPRDIEICDGFSCATLDSGLSQGAKIGIIVGAIVVVLVAVAVGITIFCCCCRAAKRALRRAANDGGNPPGGGVPLQVVTPSQKVFYAGPAVHEQQYGQGGYDPYAPAPFQQQQQQQQQQYSYPTSPAPYPAPPPHNKVETVTPSGSEYGYQHQHQQQEHHTKAAYVSPQTTGGLYSYPTPQVVSAQHSGLSAGPSVGQVPIVEPVPRTPAPAYEYQVPPPR